MAFDRDLLKAAQDGDKDALERFVEINIKLVYHILKDFRYPNIDPDDLKQAGCLGLLRAIKGYNPEYGTEFSTYAGLHIKGSMLRFIRDNKYSMHVRRFDHETIVSMQNAENTLSNKLGRPPTITEVASYCKMSEDRITSLMNATKQTKSLYEPVGIESDEEFTLFNLLSVDSHEDNIILRIQLRNAFLKLSPLLQWILRNYLRGCTQEQLGDILDCSQTTICRKLKTAIQSMRKNIEL